MLALLLDATAREGLDVQGVSGDLGYSSVSNLQAIVDAGATRYIPFKNNATPSRRGIWAQIFHLYSLHREDFLSRYHQRSNVVTTFHMVKSKFGDSVRSKTNRAMANEVRAKILCHNIYCLIQSMYESGIPIEQLQAARTMKYLARTGPLRHSSSQVSSLTETLRRVVFSPLPLRVQAKFSKKSII